jgi:hypothetical protein
MGQKQMKSGEEKMMNCEEFHKLAEALARDEGLDAATMQGALGHADSCESCDTLLEEAEALSSDLRALAVRHASDTAPIRVEKALLLAFRKRQDPATSASQLRRWSAGIAGVAAAIILVTVLASRAKLLSYPSGGTTTKQLALPDGSPGLRAGEPSAPQQAQQTVSVDNEESADSFVPLSGTYDLASLNEDAIVRVVLSGEDLESLGLPVGDSGDEQVVADLIVANDGTPQAIRVVSW